ncbi:hypothetical protein [Pseudoalteromonas sp. APC 3694]|uniref:hypothetical protein n=1 Tax=Pseudoalteromonas sp. APC 3694 TaxID=3035202 RepID=UPI0025B5078E|nr:hypothetical protein [Pseudoalteromonas sp. APC 3694]MDN3488745.1 hypothetical protein [Pseudoalteromonas sp. APC 3694]
MDLKNLFYKGHNLTSVDFDMFSDHEGKGYYNYSNEIDNDVIVIEDESDKENLKRDIQIEVNSVLEGFEQDTDVKIFSLKLKFTAVFCLYGDDILEETIGQDNEWFFLNFVAQSSKKIIESILEDTPLRGIPIPAHRSLGS